MDNRYIINTIESNISEIQNIVSQLKGDKKIPQIYIELALAKLKSLFIELLLLNKTNAEIQEINTDELYKSVEDQFEYLTQQKKSSQPKINDKTLFQKEAARTYKEIGNPFKTLVKQKKHRDLRNEIELNDKIWFIKELFGGSIDLYNQTINYLNQLEDINQAVEYLTKFFSWDINNITTRDFFEIISKKFEK
ncbi:MAG: hypothetical protein KAI79_12390 [Bacteroidales bacterium]|nr:hypothetical protein [Bacteroidales bacterium]